jgi:myxalamid-type polyketide synthase MxaB
VVVSHANLLHNSALIHRAFRHGPESRGVIWLPPYHDMGLIGGLLQPLYGGFPVVLLSPGAFIQRPLRWLQAVSRYRATTSGGPSFAYELCVERTTPEQRAGLDLSSWRLAFNGSEPVRHDTLERFARAFAPWGFRAEAFYPCYGLAEATLLVSGAGPAAPTVRWFHVRALEQNRIVSVAPRAPDAKALVSCGTVIAGECAVVDPESGRRCSAEQVGEVWLRGPSVAGGYWHRPDETRAVFQARLDNGSGPFLRTGDLGFLRDGELYITGRLRDLIIIRGTNYYPQDIERTVELCHPALRPGGAAFSFEEDSRECLAVVQEIDFERAQDPGAVFGAARAAVATEHELQVDAIVLVRAGRIPRTSSGKVQRHACRHAFLRDALPGVVASWRAGQERRGAAHRSSGVRAAEAHPGGNDQDTAHAPAGAVATLAPPRPRANGERRPSSPLPERVPPDGDLDSDFFRLFLDGVYLAESAGLWEGAADLAAAQEAKFRRLAEYARVTPGQRLLDIGCGWGGMLRFCRGTLHVRHAAGLTVSPQEFEYLAAQAPNETVVYSSWADYQAEEPFNALVCVDALPHFVSLRDRAAGLHQGIYRRFFQKCRALSAEWSFLALQTLVVARPADSPPARRDFSLLARTFPDASLPFLDDVLTAAHGLYDVVALQFVARDQERTVRAWLDNLLARREVICQRYGADVFERYRGYFEATLRCLADGYLDAVQLSLQRAAVVGNGPGMSETGTNGTAVSAAPRREQTGAPAAVPRSAGAVEAWLRANLATKLRLQVDDVDVRQPFAAYGLDSLQMVSLIGDLEVWLGRTLPPTLAWDYPTVEALAGHLAGGPEAAPAGAEPRRPQAAEPLAIIGMGCRFPGAAGLEAYWRLLRDGGEAIREVPPDRWDVQDLYDPDPDAPGKISTRWGGFLDQVDCFDPQFFGITPREAARMDPQQRLLLEVAWEALEHAGLPAERVAGGRTGVFVGIGGTDYAHVSRHFDDYLDHIDAYCGTGNALSIAANRLSYVLDLHGPSLAIDTACSSSLVALHFAAQSLRNRECDLALVGGVNLILSPEVTIAFSKARMLSPDGRCKPFDAEANGYVRGEGCGVVLLKRLGDALRDGDTILALLRGTAVNQDGKTSGITAPNGPSQQQCIQGALAQAGVTPDDIGYVEAHGTGTPLGDPIEVHALQQVMSRRSPDAPPCCMGSVKANIGHLETASGIASLIKVVLMLRHGEIPPQRNLQTVNPNIPDGAAPLVIARAARPWDAGQGRRVAGVSGFGFGGTNAHAVIEEAPVRPQESPRGSPELTLADRPLHLLPLSAHSESALRELARRYAAFLEQHPEARLADVCYSASTGRSPLPFRLSIPAEARDRLREQLLDFADSRQVTGLAAGHVKGGVRPKVAFLFTGQGAQYAGMGRRLYETQPVFRRTLDECNDVLRPELDEPLLAVLFPQPDRAHWIDETAYTQPALFALEVALARLWESWGVTPDVVLGHSVGEYAAACFAGVFTLEEGLRLIAERGRQMQALPPGGMMAVVMAPPERVLPLVERCPEQLAVAAFNGPESLVLSGHQEAVHAALRELEAAGFATRRLAVSHAFHSPLLDPVLGALERAAARIEARPPRIPLVANLTGQLFGPGEAPDAAYWRRHSREPVQFAAGMQALAGHGCDVFLEVGPTPSLLAMGRKCLPEAKGAWLPSLRKGQDDWRVLLDSLGGLFVRGARLDWAGFDRPSPRRRLALPTYPFARERYWLGPADGEKASSPARVFAPGRGGHPLLGVRLPSALPTTQFAGELSARKLPYLRDHRVQGSVVVPGAAYLEMALAAAAETFAQGTHIVENVAFQQAFFLSVKQAHAVQVVLSPERADRATFQVFQAADAAADAQTSWVAHATGTIRRARGDVTPPAPWQADLEAVRAACTEELSQEESYRRLSDRGLDYGPSFQGTQRLWKRRGETVCRVRLPAALEPQSARYQVHPAVLDTCLQAVAGAIPEEFIVPGSGETYLPTGVRQLRVYARPEGELWAHARLRTDWEKEGQDLLEGDMQLRDAQGRVVLELTGLTLRRLARSAGRDAEETPPPWLYEIRWQPAEPPQHQDLVTATQPGTWLVFADASDLGDRLATQLRLQGERCVLVRPGPEYQAVTGEAYRVNPAEPAQFGQLLQDVQGADHPPCRGIVTLWALDAPAAPELSAAALEQSTSQLCDGVLHLVQALARLRGAAAPTLCLVTRGAQAVEGEPAVAVGQAPLWGLGRVLAVEHPELRCRLVDLDPQAQAADPLLALLVPDGEDQTAYRGGRRFVPRLVRAAPEGRPQRTNRLRVPPGEPFRLELAGAGKLDRLTLRPLRRRPPGPGEVEVEVRAAGLNFSDVLKAMGLYPGLTGDVVPLGIECAGTVAAVGEGVTGLAVGDEVVAIAPFSFGSHTTTAAVAVVPKPAHISFEDAATIPITFLTAHYALQHLARVQPGERVLIHAGAGGVGLAALQVCKLAGAEVFATAGSPEKRAFLKSLGVPHVLDSRTLAFADEILEVTGGEGVDIVLNSLPGEAIPKSLRLLRAYGRFLEIGKTDIYQNRMLGLAPFQNNLSYFAIDLDRMLRQRPQAVRALFLEVMEQVAAGRYQPLPLRTFPVSDAVGAFRYMAKRKNIGKVVVSLRGGAEDHADTAVGPARADGAYLITGGLGGLGLQVARWLIRKGAKDLVLMGRSDPTPAVRATLQAWRSEGVEVTVARADVAQKDQVDRALAGIPLRGVVHAAGVLDDGVLVQLDRARFARALAPKVQGAWNLHLATRDTPLECFVLFSSVTCLFGSPGQGNYAAGNAFLDALAHERRRLGLPALAINWGPWADVGMAARNGQAEHLASRGLEPLPPAQALQILECLLDAGATQVGVMDVAWERMLACYPAGAPPLLGELAGATPAAAARDHRLRAQFVAAPPAERPAALQSYLVSQLARVMEIDPAKVEVHQPLNSLGLDSLMVIELKNRLEADTGVVLPIARFLEGPSVHQLVALVLEAFAEPAAPAAPPAASERGPSEYPLSVGQRSLWFLYRLAPESTAYNMVDAVRIRGALDVPAMRRSFQRLVDRHPLLRTTFHEVDGQPLQQIHTPWEAPFQVVDAAGWDETALQERLSTEAHTPFDLEHGPTARALLFRVAEDHHLLVFLLHHVVADIWSLVLCTHEFSALYEAERSGNVPTLPPPPSTYAAFVRWQTELLPGPGGQALGDYWMGQLAGDLPVLNLPTDRPRPPAQTFRGAWQSRRLSPELLQAVKALAEAHGATPFMTLLAAYYVLLYHYTGQEDLLVGCPTTGRPRAEFAAVVGDFVNPVVVRGDLSGNPPFATFLDRVRQTVLAAFDHQDYPFALLVEQLQPRRDPSRSPIFQTLFVMQKAQLLHQQGLTDFLMEESEAHIRLSGLEVEALPFEQRDAQFDLAVQLAEVDGGLATAFQYNTDLFDAATITRLLDHWETLLGAIVTGPGRRLSELSPLTAAEQRLLAEWNATAAPYPRDRCIHELFEAQAAKTPAAVAVVFEGQQLTYAELNRRANRLARRLRGLGVGPEVLVGLCVERSPAMVVGLLGILKAGGAYVPLDPAYPPERLAFMLDDSRAPVLVTQKHLAERFAGCVTKVVCLDADGGPMDTADGENLPCLTGPGNLAYVIYTSGSTGKPRGVLVPHRGVVNHNADCVQRYGLRPGDRVLQFASLSFDTAAEEIFPAWMAGATVVLRQDPTALSLADFLRFVDEERVTLLDLPTSYWHLWMAELARAPLPLPSALRWVIAGGDKVLPERFAAWQQYVGGRVGFSNGYGPTEATIQAVTYEVAAGQEPACQGGAVPIGRPIRNVRAHVLGAHLQLVPIGVAGELFLGGPCVARGYVNHPELTAAKFLADPFTGEPGARLYRTGDLVRWRPDGHLEFLGRIDHQVKIRGFRVELGEIEAALAEHPGVRDAVVLAREDVPGDKRLVAYVVARAPETFALGDLRGFLKQRLPGYMVPSAFVALATLPLTPNGKLDRKALPAPEPARNEADRPYVAPRTGTESLLADLWAEVLGVEQVGVTDNFFELGGDSILSLHLLARAGQAGLRLTPRQMYQHQTIAELAAAAGTGPVVLAEQGPVVGPVPLTPVQHWFFEQDLTELDRWSQVVALDVPAVLDPSVMEKVVVQFLAHHDALRLRFHRDRAGWHQAIAEPGGPVPFARVDLSGLPEADQEAALREAMAECQAGLDISAGPLVRVALCTRGSDHPSRLVLVVHHLVIDSVSWRVLLQDFLTAYQQLLLGREPRLPPKTTSFRQYAEWLIAFARSPELRAEAGYWTAQAARATPVPLPVDHPGGDNTRASADAVWVALAADETRALLRPSAAQPVPVNALPLTALVRACNAWTGRPGLLIDLEGHGREGTLADVDLSRTVGWMAAIYPAWLELPAGATAGDALRYVRAQLEGVPRQGIGYGLLRYLAGDPDVAARLRGACQPEVCFNYVGQFDALPLAASTLAPAHQSVGHVHSAQGLRRYLLDFNGHVAEGRLQAGFTYSKNLHERATIERLARDFLDALRDLIRLAS